MTQSRIVEFAGVGGEVLAGRLDLPAGVPRGYALFAHCFTCGKDAFAASRISRALTEHGVAVLRFDFTGLGESGGDFAGSTFSSNVADLVRAADHLRATVAAPTLLGGLAPRVLAADPDGSLTGQPVIVTTMLRGGACITPEDPTDFATQLGRALARVHAHDASPWLPEVMAAAFPVDGATAASPRDAWDRLFLAPRVLTHFDFWSGNTLWHESRLTGIVDWSGAGLAPRGSTCPGPAWT